MHPADKMVCKGCGCSILKHEAVARAGIRSHIAPLMLVKCKVCNVVCKPTEKK